MEKSASTITTSDIAQSVIDQAKVRTKLGFPVAAAMLLTIWIQGETVPFHSPFYVGSMTGIYLVYNFSALIFALRRTFSPTSLVLFTSIMDPLMLSGWLALVHDAGPLFVAFYLFTILGFGFRIGTQPMWICQIFSLVGFLLVIAVSPTWQANVSMTLSFLIFLVIVPLYATVLIKKLRDARALAEHESKAKSRLLANVSHELRTPLTGIVANTQLIQLDTQDDGTLQRAEAILRLSNDLLTEINDLLDSSKYHSGGLTLDSAPVSLPELMEKVKTTLTQTAAKKGIELLFYLDEKIQLPVMGDAHYLNRILMNLSSNAVKFTDEGKVEVRLTLVQEIDAQYEINFSISDTGIGIPKEQQQQIFEPFYQISSGNTRKYSGTGLGMSIARDLVAMMGGEITLESELGKGSRFAFNLKMPIATKIQAIQDDQHNEKIVYRKNILIADDNATNLLVLQELLAKDNHIVTTASTGEDTLILLSSMQFDLVFLDFNMGDMDGATIMQIYQFGTLNPVPVYFLTADASQATQALLRDSGAKGVLHKPITIQKLRSSIADLFGEEAIEAPIKNEPAMHLRAVEIEYVSKEVISELRALSPRTDFIMEVFSHALVDIRNNAQLLNTAVDQNDITHVREKAHALKSVCSSIGAFRLSKLSEKLMGISLEDLKKNKARWKTDLAEEESNTCKTIEDMMALEMH